MRSQLDEVELPIDQLMKQVVLQRLPGRECRVVLQALAYHKLSSNLVKSLSQSGHKFAVVKLYPGLDETIFGKLLNGLGLEVAFTDDPSECLHFSGVTPAASVLELDEDKAASVEPRTISPEVSEQAVREWINLLEFIDSTVNIDLHADKPERNASNETVEPEEQMCSALKEVVEKSITCMLCDKIVSRDKKSLKQHVQFHSGKRYGCSRCKYHTDRKFDFTRHIRRRHDGIPDPVDGGSRPHWMCLLRSCFPNYGDESKQRRRRKKGSVEQSDTCGQMKSKRRLRHTSSTADCPPIVC